MKPVQLRNVDAVVDEETGEPLNPLGRFVNSRLFRSGIMALIVVNAAMLGLMTSQSVMLSFGDVLQKVDRLILFIFVVEIALRLVGDPKGSLRSGWFWFDFIIVSLSFMPASSDLAILRTLRVLRILRLLSAFEKTRRVVVGLLSAIPGMLTVLAVLGIIFYAFAVLATKTFGANNGELAQDLFGTLGASFFTLFQVMTLENWADGIARPMMEIYPWAWLFFVVFVVVTAFAVLNLFIGIIVDAMQDDREEALEEHRDEVEQFERERFDEILAEVKALRQEVTALRKDSVAGGGGSPAGRDPYYG